MVVESGPKITMIGNSVQPHLNISGLVPVRVQSKAMDIQEIRRGDLRAIIDRMFDGVAGRLADAARKPRPNIGQILSIPEAFVRGVKYFSQDYPIWY